MEKEKVINVLKEDKQAFGVTLRKKQGQFADDLLKYSMQPENKYAMRVIIALDMHGKNKIKESAQDRSEPGKFIAISSMYKKIPKDNDQTSFLCNGENKNQLVSFLVDYYKKNTTMLTCD